jgi:hypothetical protein
MFNMSASMGPKFAEVADEMTRRLEKLGPNPLRGIPRPEKIEAAAVNKDEGEMK